MKVLLLLGFAAVAQCALLGSKKCTYGPSYWCSHIHHAKECSAMNYCMTTVWMNQRPGFTGSTETCSDVIKVLDVVRHASDADLLERMAEGCTGMPAEKRSLCKELMSHDVNEVHQLLKSDLSSMQIAAALKLCGGFGDTVPHHGQVSGDYCKDCINFFGDLRELFNNSEGQAETFLKNMVCTKLGPLQSMCDQLVDQYTTLIFNMVYQQLNPHDICLQLHLCANQTQAHLMKTFKYMLTKRQRSSEECDICKTVAKDLQDVLQDTTFQNDVLTALEDKVCPLLGSFAAQCKTYVAQYGPLVFEVAIAELDPSTICETLGLCNATKTENGKLTHVPLGSPMGTVQILAPKTEVKNFVECDVCKFLVRQLKGIIEDKTEEEAIAAMKKLCRFLPTNSSREQCDQFVDDYGTQIFELLFSKLTPEEVCTELGACTAAKLLQLVKPGKPTESSGTCEICELVMNEIKEVLNTSTTKADIEKLLDKACDPAGRYKQTCELFVNQYSPTIINMIEQNIDPAKICTELRLCTTTVKRNKSQPLKFLPMMELQTAKPHMLGTDKCLYGPSFWCASVQNARQCNAVEHCKKNYNMKLDD